MADSLDINWWLERLDDVKPAGNGWIARCPAHSDPKGSLSLSVDPQGEVLVHCFAGCQYRDILQRIEEPMTVSVTPTTIAPNLVVPAQARDWWAEYTCVPSEFWEGLGVRFVGPELIFTWKGSKVTKSRRAGTKDFIWTPKTLAAAPPIWPDVPDCLPTTIYLCEGESDTGIARFLGLEAFGVTKGSLTPQLERIFIEFRSRGVKEIISLFDLDSGGKQGSDLVLEACANLGLGFHRGNLSAIVHPLLGEKDLRDAWIRTQDKSIIRSLDLTNTSSSRRYLLLDEFLSRPAADASWFVPRLVLKETVQMIVGSPKIGKSWLALDLGLSVASGKPFLGYFDVETTAPVVIVTKEDPDYLLRDRMIKISIAKGLGGSSIISGRKNGSVTLPPGPYPVFLDLNRDFLFTDEASRSLLAFLESISLQYGKVGLVVFDPTLRMVNDIDEYKASEVAGSIFRISEQIRTTIGASVILVHHRSKGGVDGKNSYGSMAFHAFSDATWYLGTPDAEGWVGVHSEFKSAKEWDWKYRLPNLEVSYNPQVSEEFAPVLNPSKSLDLSMIIPQLLSKFPEGLTVQEISAGIPGASDFMCRQSLRILEKKRLVERRKDDRPGGVGAKRDLWIPRMRTAQSTDS